MSEHDFWATLRPESPRYADWQRVFGPEAQLGTSGVEIPISSPIPERVRLPIGERRVLFIATDQLSEAQRDRLVEHLATRFQCPRHEVRRDIMSDPRKSVPILDEDLFVAVLHPQRWFG